MDKLCRIMLLTCACFALFEAVRGRGTPLKDAKEGTCDRTYTGCSLHVDSGECVCSEAQACDNPFPYRDMKQCQKDIKGVLDKCRKEPCVHGVCVQTKHYQSRRWECSCAGSGFYGRKCEKECPPYEEENLPKDYPSDCVY